MKELRLYKNKNTLSNFSTLVDDDVYELLKGVRIYLVNNYDKRDPDPKKWKVCKRYAEFCKKKITGRDGLQYLHRFILERSGVKVKDIDVDHINGNSLDNRVENLRASNHSTNGANRGCNINKKTSKYKNIVKARNGRWQVNIMKAGKSYTWFSSKNILECIIFANILRKELFGEFTWVELIEGWSDEEILAAKQAVLEKIFKHNLKHSFEKKSNYVFVGSNSNSEFKSKIISGINLKTAEQRAKNYLKSHMEGFNVFSCNIYVIDLVENKVVSGFELREKNRITRINQEYIDNYSVSDFKI